jgi:hypothetical protein
MILHVPIMLLTPCFLKPVLTTEKKKKHLFHTNLDTVFHDYVKGRVQT